MQNKKVIEIRNFLRKNAKSDDYIHEFIMNYYLSKKLKNNSIDQILEGIENERIKYNLKLAYEEGNNQIEYFNNLEDFSLEEILEIIDGLAEYENKRGQWENTTVKSIIDLSIELLNLKKEDKLLDIGSGIGTTLLSASKKSDIAGIEVSLKNYELSYMLLDLFDLPLNKLEYKDAFTYNLNKFDSNKIFMNMPMATRISTQRLDEILGLKFKHSTFKNFIKPNDSSWILALDIINNTRYEKFVMLVNGNPLYSETQKETRKLLTHGGKVEAVIALPSNLLPYTAIPLYLVVFSHNNKDIKFVDATKLYSEIKYKNIIEEKHIQEIIKALREETKIGKKVENQSLEKEDFTFDPLRYTRPDFPFADSIELKNVIKSITRGNTIKKKDLDQMTSAQPSNYQYLLLQNFQDGIIEGDLPYLKDLDESYERYLLKDNSIIISRLAPFKIGSVGRLKTKVLANGNLFFLEIDEEKINKNFLTAYLQSRIGLREIEKYAKGSTMKTISIKDLEKVKIPKISMDKQIEIGEKSVLLNSEFKAIKKRAEEIAEERLNIFEGGM